LIVGAVALGLGLYQNSKINKINETLKHQHAYNYKQQVYEDFLLAQIACGKKVVDEQGGKKVKSEEKLGNNGEWEYSRGWCAKARLLGEYYWRLKLDYIVQSEDMDHFNAEHYFYLNGMGANAPGTGTVPPAHEAGK
jgi:hypothetical protein